ncbi:MAG: prophage helix-destabilizing protein [Pseudomonas sp.]|nr:prophage helix-destabilizing protein [Pseudomonas sp.]
MAAKSIVIAVQVTGVTRSGIAKASGNPFVMAEGYASLPNIPYPQRFMFYCAGQNEVPQPGFYECDVECGIKNDRIEFTVDPRQGRRIADPVAKAG